MPGLKKEIKKPIPSAKPVEGSGKSLNNSLKLLLGIFVLKTKTDKDAPMNCSELVENIGKFTHYDVGDANGRRLGDGLELIAALQEKGVDSITIALGGKIVQNLSTSSNHSEKKAKGDSRYFYFEPLLSESHTDLINSLIISERHLSDPLKDFLHERVTALNPFPYQLFENLESKVTTENEKVKLSDKKSLYEDIKLYAKDLTLKILTKTGEPKLSKKPVSDKITEPHAVDFIDQIEVIQTLYFAIKNGDKVKITYGKFQFNEDKMGHPMFRIQQDDGEAKQYILSPYAMAWSGGHYYLICKKDNKENLSVYRVDRIKTADYCKVPSENQAENDEVEYEKSEPLPEEYADFRIKEKDGFSFDIDSFLKTFPLMITGNGKKEASTSSESEKQSGISIKNSNLINTAHILCGDTGYSILVDYFGDSIRGKLTSADSDSQESAHFPYLISLKNIGEDALIRLCLNYHSVMTLKEPIHLAKQVRENLKASLSLYDELVDNEA